MTVRETEKPMTFTDDDVVFGVIIDRDHLASGKNDAGPALFYKRAKALIFKAELVRECRFNPRRMKVVKVKAEYTIL